MIGLTNASLLVWTDSKNENDVGQQNKSEKCRLKRSFV